MRWPRAEDAVAANADAAGVAAEDAAAASARLAAHGGELPVRTGLTFDPIAAAESAADLTLALLFNPQRANRLVEYHAREAAEPSLDDVIEATLKVTATPGDPQGLTLEVRRAIDSRIVEAVLGLAASPGASVQTRATVRAALHTLRDELSKGGSAGAEQAFRAMEASRIEEFFRDPAKFVPARPIPAPPGMPIGEEE